MKSRITLALLAITVQILGFAGSTSALAQESTKPVPFYEGVATSAISGWDFMLKADGTDIWQLDTMIVDAVLAGNVPSQLRTFRKVCYTTQVDASVPAMEQVHLVEMWVLPDYVSVGNDSDYVRMPMSPVAAQQIADALDCSLPTTYLVDRINDAAEGHLDIFPFRPRGSRNQDPIVFQDHNNVIKALYKAKGYEFGQFISGLKKDIVLTCRLEREPALKKNVAIYGWHHPDGHPQQPLFVRHASYYADYSHGVRLIYRTIKVDSKEYDLRELMKDPDMYRLVSDEEFPLLNASLAGQR